MRDAIEVDVDAIADGKDVFICGVMEHIEEAGVHSGDSACSLPPHSLKPEIVADMERQTVELARALNVVGLMNVQFAIQNDDIYILEVNPRASRTVPFVAKVIGLPIAGIAAEVMAGKTLASFGLKRPDARPYRGEGGGVPLRPLPRRRSRARARDALDRRGDGHRPRLCHRLRQEPARRRLEAPAVGHGVRLGQGRRQGQGGGADPRELAEMGFRIIATRGTKRHLDAHGIQCERVNKVLEGRPHIVDAITNGEVDIVFNTTEGAKALADSFSIRRSALLYHIPYYTTLAGALAVTEAIKALRAGSLTSPPCKAMSASAPESIA